MSVFDRHSPFIEGAIRDTNRLEDQAAIALGASFVNEQGPVRIPSDAGRLSLQAEMEIRMAQAKRWSPRHQNRAGFLLGVALRTMEIRDAQTGEHEAPTETELIDRAVEAGDII